MCTRGAFPSLFGGRAPLFDYAMRMNSFAFGYKASVKKKKKHCRCGSMFSRAFSLANQPFCRKGLADNSANTLAVSEIMGQVMHYLYMYRDWHIRVIDWAHLHLRIGNVGIVHLNLIQQEFHYKNGWQHSRTFGCGSTLDKWKMPTRPLQN